MQHRMCCFTPMLSVQVSNGCCCSRMHCLCHGLQELLRSQEASSHKVAMYFCHSHHDMSSPLSSSALLLASISALCSVNLVSSAYACPAYIYTSICLAWEGSEHQLIWTACNAQGKRIGVISSIAVNPNNDEEINAKFAQAVDDLRSAGGLPCPALPCPALPCPALPCPALQAQRRSRIPLHSA